jgi:hypothetical protein
MKSEIACFGKPWTGSIPFLEIPRNPRILKRQGILPQAGSMSVYGASLKSSLPTGHCGVERVGNPGAVSWASAHVGLGLEPRQDYHGPLGLW